MRAKAIATPQRHWDHSTVGPVGPRPYKYPRFEESNVRAFQTLAHISQSLEP